MGWRSRWRDTMRSNLRPSASPDARETRPGEDVTRLESLSPAAALSREPSLLKPEALALERPIEDYIREDPYRIPLTRDREGYGGDRHFDYWLSGLKDYLAIRASLRRIGAALDGGAVLDFGCASGRVLRHLHAHEKSLELWGCDINPRHVEWIQRHLGPELKVFCNPAFPSLPLEDRQLALVYAFSVFTHIDEMELAWLAELRRVLRPGGHAYLTIASDRTWSTVVPGSSLYLLLSGAEARAAGRRVAPEMFAEPMPAKRVAFVWGGAGPANVMMFHSAAHVREVWGRFFQVLEIVPEGHDYQDVVLLRRP